MNDSLPILFVLAVLFVLIIIWAALGHVIWLALTWFLRNMFGTEKMPLSVTPLVNWVCLRCDSKVLADIEFCPTCGASKPTTVVVELLKELAATERQLGRLNRAGKLDEMTLSALKVQLQKERERFMSKPSFPLTQEVVPDNAGAAKGTPKVTPSSTLPTTAEYPPVVMASVVSTAAIVYERVPSFRDQEEDLTPNPAGFSSPKPPRKPFTEMLNSFMEESNIRWGEIIGGLLIIGCSTALTVSLWAEISRIPVLKFLIFTSVTAVLFGVGLYSEHRWKLPTTSRGILTIATLLVPLNFLAIAAVSSNTTTGALVIASELLAPGIFLCLVYFAGRVITQGCAHLLSAGVLGSSIGQLLVRHFASPDASSVLLIFLGAFPVVCYIVTVGLALRYVLADREIDESETSILFTILGTMSFAALLPFGLLLHKSGPLPMTMMYLAPMVTLWGLPMLATGTFLWRRISDPKLVASRTTGTALGVLGTMIVLVGMLLAWPNPASIVPTALLNFAVFTSLAVVLELPAGQLIATGCLALAYLVLFHVMAGYISWQNLRVASLLRVSLTAVSGQALTGMVVICLVVSEWLVRVRRDRDSDFYLLAASLIAILSLALVTLFGLWNTSEIYQLWPVFGIYSFGAFWIAWRRRLSSLSWVGSALLLFAFAQGCAQSLEISFPWQTAFLIHASVCSIAAISVSRNKNCGALSDPLRRVALCSSLLALVCLLQANPWQVTAAQVERIFWIAGIWLVLLWLNRSHALFVAFQAALTVGCILTVKASLQEYVWYAYLPHAFLHPWGLQIQGTVLVLLSLVWTGIRLAIRNGLGPEQADKDETSHTTSGNLEESWLESAWRLLNTKHSVDRLISWAVLGAFLLLAFYGTLSGITLELAGRTANVAGWDIAGFPHQEALGVGSWIIWGLLSVEMLATQWERRQRIYVLGALAALTGAMPLIAGQFESQLASATAWRWLAAMFFVTGSILLWSRDWLARQLRIMGWPGFQTGGNQTRRSVQTLLLTVTMVPLLTLTIYPALRAIYYSPVHGPASGFFAWLDDDFSYGVPLMLVASAFIGHAIRERKADYAMAAGFLCNLTLTMMYLLAVAAVGGSMNRVVLVRTVQLNAISFGIYALSWLSCSRYWQRALTERQLGTARFWLSIQNWIGIALNAIVILPTTIGLFFWPESVEIGTFAVGGVAGWFALGASSSASRWIRSAAAEKVSTIWLAIFLVAAGCLLALTFADWNVSMWTGLHTLEIAAVCTAFTIFLVSLRPSLTASSSGPLSAIFGLEDSWLARSQSLTGWLASLAAVVTLRTNIGEPDSQWWEIYSLLAIGALFAALNWQTLKRRYIYAAGILFNIAFSIWWTKSPHAEPPSITAFVEANLIALTLSSLWWLWLELRARRLDQGLTKSRAELSFHNIAAVLSLLTLFLIVWAGFGFDPEYSPLSDMPGLSWLTVASVGALLIACLWDQLAKYATAGLYVLGLLAGAIALQQLALPTTRLVWSVTVFLSIFALVTSLLWHWRLPVFDLLRQLGIPDRIKPDADELQWLVALNLTAVAVVLSLAYWVDLTFFDVGLRVTAALAVTAQSATLSLLSNSRLRDRWLRAAFGVWFAGLVLFGWAWLTPEGTGTWLNRSVILMVEAFIVTTLCGLGVKKARLSWPNLANTVSICTPWVLGLGVVALSFCLGTEVFYQINFGSVCINLFSQVTIGLALVTAGIMGVLFALSPGHDPLELSDRGRTRYVYATEVMLALLFLHVRLTMPWVFTGLFERYWPFVVMAIAYLGVIASEALRRREILVLSKPIERTGAFLPLLPVLGFWLSQSNVDYSSLLFVVGGLYGLLSLLRRSFVWGIAAAIAGNGGLWYLLHRTADYQFFQHPQLWLIPVAASVLLAAHLNEDNLTADQMSAIRYLSLVTIYASSTGDIFINGVANSPWLPLILGTFALAGVFSGIMLRIRGLLLLGSVFLLLAIVTMIWYASANLGWTWLWYVAGIATGATIIFMFAMFEKKRNEVLRLVEGLKDWER
jgi:hypothetical protein